MQSKFFEPRDAEELYDLDSDPYETENLSKDPAYQEILLEMRGDLVEWVKGMPDLSFYPENVLKDQAFDNPVVFGQQHQDEIAELIDIADLSLHSFDEAREGINAALSSGNPMKIYWGLITCSSFGQKSEPFFNMARGLCSHDDLLVRARAAEFLGLTGVENPAAVITEALRQTVDGVEALLILNSLVLLMDGPHTYEFVLSNDDLAPEVLEDSEVQRRLEYIYSRMGQPKKL